MVQRPLLTSAALLVLLAGCDKPGAPASPAGAAAAPIPPVIVRSDATTAALAGLFRGAGVEIPPVRALATLPWGQLAGFKVAAQDAAREWERLRAATDKTGYYPIIALNQHGFLANIGEVGSRGPIEDMLERVGAIDPVAWFDEREKENLSLDPGCKMPRGPWKDTPPHSGLESLQDHRGEWEPDVYILLLPTREPWQVFLYLGWGGWNACPDEAVHGACFKRWQSLYGAEPVLISHDIIEARVARPPQTKDDALALAREQYLYCSDIVDQGVGTLEALGAELKGGGHWYFWWD